MIPFFKPEDLKQQLLLNRQVPLFFEPQVAVEPFPLIPLEEQEEREDIFENLDLEMLRNFLARYGDNVVENFLRNSELSEMIENGQIITKPQIADVVSEIYYDDFNWDEFLKEKFPDLWSLMQNNEDLYQEIAEYTQEIESNRMDEDFIIAGFFNPVEMSLEEKSYYNYTEGYVFNP